MPDENTPEVQPQPAQGVVVDNPHLDNANATVAPELDNELDNALNAVFKDKITNEPKQNETTKENKKQPEKSESKEDKKSDSTKQPVEGELPTPESLDNDIPKKLSEKGMVGWTALKNSYKQAHKIIEQKEEELKKLKAGLAEKGTLSAKEIEDLKAQVKDLSRYRAMIDIQADPEFVSKYDQPINKIQTSIKDLLISLNVEKSVVDQVDFSNTKLMQDIIGHVGENRDKFIARKLERQVEEMINLVDKRDETLSEQKTSYKEFIENKKKESSMKGAEDEGRMFKYIESQAAAQDEAGNPNIPFLRKMTPKEGASQAELDQVGKHNKLVDVMQQEVHKAIKIDSPEGKANLALAAVGSYWLNAQLKTANSKIRGLEEELKKISTVGSSSSLPKTKSASTNTSTKDMDLDSALSQHFSR